MKNRAYKLCIVANAIVCLLASDAYGTQQLPLAVFTTINNVRTLCIGTEIQFGYCDENGSSHSRLPKLWHAKKVMNIQRGIVNGVANWYMYDEYVAITKDDLLYVLQRVANGIEVISCMINIQGNATNIKDWAVQHDIDAGHCGRLFGSQSLVKTMINENVDNCYAKKACVQIFNRDNLNKLLELHVNRWYWRQRWQNSIVQQPKSMWILPESVYNQYRARDFVLFPYRLVEMKNKNYETQGIVRHMYIVYSAMLDSWDDVSLFEMWRNSANNINACEAVYVWDSVARRRL